ncbi:transporter substrate-binding domain-containing protein [Acinetobacter sp. MD2]|uniref:transporter substrate-binding domain-containing protein n=1 Tax=Acinetobacter sp. MD2 TaxID=2600066 RepID=UPI003B63935A
MKKLQFTLKPLLACFSICTIVSSVAFASDASDKLTASASTLNQVMNNGVLKVCLTGDYKPYTHLKANGDYEGIDIGMAESLAKSLGVKTHYVKSTWKSIIPDVVAAKCDIAVGGISVTLARQQQVFFSQRLDIDGKIPLVHCKNKKKYQSIA